MLYPAELQEVEQFDSSEFAHHVQGSSLQRKDGFPIFVVDYLSETGVDCRSSAPNSNPAGDEGDR